MEVLIVAKTHMKNGACIGGFDIENHKNIRLLSSSAENHPNDTRFDVGQVWDIRYTSRSNIIAPHVEDVLVQEARYMRFQTNLRSFLQRSALLWGGPPSVIFDGKVHFEYGKSGYITKNRGLPEQSVGFWLADKDLEFSILDGDKHYFYFGDNNEIVAFPYVGFAQAVSTIKKGTLIRVSLARWWKPDSRRDELRCYCQLSGWYTDD